MDWVKLRRADRVMAVPDTAGPFEPITDHRRIDALAAFLADHADGWTAPSPQVPRVTYRVIFYLDQT